MKLYLVQHGLAVDKKIDPDRPLSEEGKKDVQRIAGFLTRSGMQVSNVLHSGKTRAQQTADILASTLGQGSTEKLDHISPNDALEPAIEVIQSLNEDTMLVGHLPYMQRMVSFLLAGNEATGFHYLPGSIVCLNQTETGWEMNWMVRPDLITD